MHESDPDEAKAPVVAATPVLLEAEPRANPLPYIAVLALSVLGIWGLFTMDRDDDPPEAHKVAYVEQKLAPSTPPFVPKHSRAVVTNRMAEDLVRDEMNEIRRKEIADDDNRLDSYTAPHGSEVATVDLSEPAPVAADLLGTKSKPDTLVASYPEVALPDLDYSQYEIAAMSEQNLKATLERLDADLERSESLAKETGQSKGLKTLEQRLKAVEDRFGKMDTPVSQADRLTITRQLAELRDELSAFQVKLQGLN